MQCLLLSHLNSIHIKPSRSSDRSGTARASAGKLVISQQLFRICSVTCNSMAPTTFLSGTPLATRAAGRPQPHAAGPVAVQATSAFERTNPHREELAATAKYIATRGKGILASGVVPAGAVAVRTCL